MDTSREAARAQFYRNPRKGGAFLVVAGAFMLFKCVYEPLQQAMDGAEKVQHLSGKGTMAGVAGVILGLGLLVGGSHVGELMHPPPGKSRVPGIIVGVLLASAGFGVYYAVKSHVESLGYTFHF